MGDVRVGVLGAGRWGRNLVRTLDELGALAAIADPSALVRDEMVATFPQAKVLHGPDELFATDVDAVVIATPAPTHAGLAIAAIEAGKDVFVEKPFTLTADDASRVVEAGRSADRVVMVGHLLLYQSAIVFIREYLASGSIGGVAFLNQDRLNLGTVRTAENALWSLGVHDVAAMLYLVGQEPDRVDAWGQCVLQPRVEDDVHLHMLFPSGAEGHIHASWLWPERRRRLTIVGTESMLTYDEDDHAVRLHRRRATGELGVVDDGSEVLFAGDPRPVGAELAHFIDAVEHHSIPRSDGSSAVPVIRVLEQSAQQLRRFE